MRKFGFTLTELVAALVVISIVVTATLPVTRAKLKKVSTGQYYMAYDMLRQISPNVDAVPSNEPLIDINGVKISQIIPGSELEDMFDQECEVIGYLFGSPIQSCHYSSDDTFWQEAANRCGGLDNMPSRSQLDTIAKYLYDTDDLSSDTLTLNLSKVKKLLGTESSDFSIWSNEDSGTKINNVNMIYIGSFDANEYSQPVTPYHQAGPYIFCLNGSSNDASAFVRDITEDLNYNYAEPDKSASPVRFAAASLDFSDVDPHVRFTNGLKLFVDPNSPEILNDSSDERDARGVTVYVDINGDKGKGLLNQDVFAFYMLSSGKVVPAYSDYPKRGANNAGDLSFNVLYDHYDTENNRSQRFLLKDTNFQKAACSIGYVRSAKYCDSYEMYDLCKKPHSDCRMQVIKPIKPL